METDALAASCSACLICGRGAGGRPAIHATPCCGAGFCTHCLKSTAAAAGKLFRCPSCRDEHGFLAHAKALGVKVLDLTPSYADDADDALMVVVKALRGALPVAARPRSAVHAGCSAKKLGLVWRCDPCGGVGDLPAPAEEEAFVPFRRRDKVEARFRVARTGTAASSSAATRRRYRVKYDDDGQIETVPNVVRIRRLAPPPGPAARRPRRRRWGPRPPPASPPPSPRPAARAAKAEACEGRRRRAGAEEAEAVAVRAEAVEGAAARGAGGAATAPGTRFVDEGTAMVVYKREVLDVPDDPDDAACTSTSPWRCVWFHEATAESVPSSPEREPRRKPEDEEMVLREVVDDEVPSSPEEPRRKPEDEEMAPPEDVDDDVKLEAEEPRSQYVGVEEAARAFDARARTFGRPVNFPAAGEKQAVKAEKRKAKPAKQGGDAPAEKKRRSRPPKEMIEPVAQEERRVSLIGRRFQLPLLCSAHGSSYGSSGVVVKDFETYSGSQASFVDVVTLRLDSGSLARRVPIATLAAAPEKSEESDDDDEEERYCFCRDVAHGAMICCSVPGCRAWYHVSEFPDLDDDARHAAALDYARAAMAKRPQKRKRPHSDDAVAEDPPKAEEEQEQEQDDDDEPEPERQDVLLAANRKHFGSDLKLKSKFKARTAIELPQRS
ncbi:hypothetical protein JL720_5672 [Aureococcus anophagefferens]|nr:hypothetical protein JL720_5672 [Aureococcus anophagefferens]